MDDAVGTATEAKAGEAAGSNPPPSVEGKASDPGTPSKTAKAKWDLYQASDQAGQADFSGGRGEMGEAASKAILESGCQQGTDCTVLHGAGKMHCSPSGSGTCHASQCDGGFEIDTETQQCKPKSGEDDCRYWSLKYQNEVKEQGCSGKDGKGHVVCDQESGESHCAADSPSGSGNSEAPPESGGFWGFLGVLMIGGVVGGMVYMKGHLPPQVQAYLGGPATKTHGGSEYEMVPMQARDESLGVTDRPIDTHQPAVSSHPSAASQSFAQEDPEEWSGDEDDGWDDDGWGADDDSWGGKGPASVRPVSSDEASQNARFNRNR